MGVFAPLSRSKAECEAARRLLHLADFSGVVGKQMEEAGGRKHTWKMDTEEYH